MLGLIKKYLPDVNLTKENCFIFGDKENKAKKIVVYNQETNFAYAFLKVSRNSEIRKRLLNELAIIKRLMKFSEQKLLECELPIIYSDKQVNDVQVNCYKFISYPALQDLLKKEKIYDLSIIVLEAKKSLDKCLFLKKNSVSDCLFKTFTSSCQKFLKTKYSNGIRSDDVISNLSHIEHIKLGFVHNDFIPSNIKIDVGTNRVILTDFEWSNFQGLCVIDLYWFMTHVFDQSQDKHLLWIILDWYRRNRDVYFYDSHNIERAEIMATYWFIFDILTREGQYMSANLQKDLLECLKLKTSIYDFLGTKC